MRHCGSKPVRYSWQCIAPKMQHQKYIVPKTKKQCTKDATHRRYSTPKKYCNQDIIHQSHNVCKWKLLQRGFHVNIDSKSYSLPYQSNQLQNVIATELRALFLVFLRPNTNPNSWHIISNGSPLKYGSFATNCHNRRTYLGGFPPECLTFKGNLPSPPIKLKGLTFILDYPVDGAGVPCQYIILSLNMSVILKKNKGIDWLIDWMFYFQSQMVMVLFPDW